MWACFPFRSLFRRQRQSEERSAVPVSWTSLDKTGVEQGGWYVLAQFTNETNRKAVQFAPPVPALARCSMCGLVPPRVFKSGSCQHAFCSLCEVHAQAELPVRPHLLETRNDG
ncbi:hypothetical protein MTO96_023929 [Rhipicephalus appendiculatus]